MQWFVRKKNFIYDSSKMRKRCGHISMFFFCMTLIMGGGASQEKAKAMPPATTAELRERIKEVLQETKTPGAGVAIVRREGTEWIAGIGLADVAAVKPVTPDTLFRIGSVSKTFVALSILKLQQEGKLSLGDTLRSKTPEIVFTNRWEETDPVRIVHLLEHTAGFDDRALRERASNDPKPLTSAEGLAFHPASRTVRWRPGTRYSYSNPGPAVAAYVVEKISNTRFEDYVTEHWLRPLGMTTAGYFLTPQTERLLTKLYRADGLMEVPYWHNIHRPSGAVNASTYDMANLVQFFLNRGTFEGKALLPAEAIERMERPESSLAVREGLKSGYGLCNYTSIKEGFVYQGHNGGMPGALTEFAYLPEAGIGYVWMINSGNESAAERMDALIRAYITRHLPKPVLPQATEGPSVNIAREYSGWFEPMNSRNEILHFAERIFGLAHLQVAGRNLTLRFLTGTAHCYVSQGENLFRPGDGPIPTLVLAKDRAEGILVLTTRQSLRRIPAWLAWIEIGLPVLAALCGGITLFLVLFGVGCRIFRHKHNPQNFRSGLLPFPAVAALVFGCGILIGAEPDLAGRLGVKTFWSLGFYATTILFALFSVGGLIETVRCRRTASRLLWWHAFVSCLLFSIITFYLARWGVIGIRTWT